MMATLFGSLKGLVHDTSAALVDKEIPSKLSETFSGFLKSGFGIVDDVLTILRDLTAPDETQSQPEPPASSQP
jgi:hypothetical protein